MLKKNPGTSIECSVGNKAVSLNNTSNEGGNISLNRFGDELLIALSKTNAQMQSRIFCNHGECHCWKGFEGLHCKQGEYAYSISQIIGVLNLSNFILNYMSPG